MRLYFNIQFYIGGNLETVLALSFMLKTSHHTGKICYLVFDIAGMPERKSFLHMNVYTQVHNKAFSDKKLKTVNSKFFSSQEVKIQ